MSAESTSSPFSVVSGNLLLGGLPRSCGPEVAVLHLESLASLGAQIERDERSLDRTLSEVKAEAQSTARVHEVLSAAFSRALEAPSTSLMDAVFPFHEWLQEHLFDESLVLAGRFGIVLKVDRSEAFAALASFFAGPPQRTVADALACMSSRELSWWELSHSWEPLHRHRTASISTEHLLLGLHELDRIPWSEYGGLVAWRGASDAYLHALQALNRDVVAAYVLHDWHNAANERVEWMKEALDDLIRFSLPFPLEPQLSRLLSAVSRLYMGGEFAASVVLARSTLESAMTRTHASLQLEPQSSLAGQVNQLFRAGILSQAQLQAATDVRIGGNKAVHEQFPQYNTRTQATRAIASLLVVLGALRPHISVDRGAPPI